MNRQELGRSLGMIEELIAPGRPNRSGVRIVPQFITVHNTSNTGPGADAKAHSRFIRNTGFYTLPSGKKNQVSWHYSVDDKCVIKHLPINERAIHAAEANGVSIAIEICMHRGIDQPAANARAARLVAALLHDLRLSRSAIRTHKSWTGKACPVLLLPRWNAFLDQVEAIRASIAAPQGDVLVSDIERSELESPLPADATEGFADEPDHDHDAMAAALAEAIARGD